MPIRCPSYLEQRHRRLSNHADVKRSHTVDIGALLSLRPQHHWNGDVVHAEICHVVAASCVFSAFAMSSDEMPARRAAA
jgi:hypothetical protein